MKIKAVAEIKSCAYKKYKTEILPALKKQFAYDNDFSVPKIQKVTINVGINSRNTDSGKQCADGGGCKANKQSDQGSNRSGIINSRLFCGEY